MQDVHRGEVAPWGVGGHREGPSKAWPAVRMRGRGLSATFLLRFSGRLAAFDDLVTLTVRAADGDERHRPFLPKRGYKDEAQCDINPSPSPLLKHYQTLQVWGHMLKVWLRSRTSGTKYHSEHDCAQTHLPSPLRACYRLTHIRHAVCLSTSLAERSRVV